MTKGSSGNAERDRLDGRGTGGTGFGRTGRVSLETGCEGRDGRGRDGRGRDGRGRDDDLGGGSRAPFVLAIPGGRRALGGVAAVLDSTCQGRSATLTRRAARRRRGSRPRAEDAAWDASNPALERGYETPAACVGSARGVVRGWAIALGRAKSSRLSNRAMTGVGRTLPFRCRENPQTCRDLAARLALLARGGSTARAFESSRRRARARGVARGAVRRAPPRVRVAPFASLFVPVGSSERHVPAPSATTAMDAESNDALGRARADAPDSRTRLSSSASSSSASSSAPDATLLAPVSFALRPSRARPGPLAHRTHHHPHHHPHHPGVILPPVQSSRAVAARRRTDTDVVASASFVLGGVGISSSTAVAETGVDVGGVRTSTTGRRREPLRKPHRLHF